MMSGSSPPAANDFFQTLRFNIAGADRIDADVVFRDFQRERLGIPDDATPCRDRQTEAGDRLDRRDRSDVENATASRFDHVRDDSPRHPYDVHQVLLDGFRPGRIVKAAGVTQWRSTIVVDKNVDATKLVQHGLDDPIAILGATAVALNGQYFRTGLATKSFCRPNKARLASGHDRDACTFFCQSTGDSITNADAGTANDCNLVGEFEIHQTVCPKLCRKRSAFSWKTFSRIACGIAFILPICDKPLISK